MTRTALVTGASIAGLATAWWLGRSGWDVRVVEQAASFRDGGQNVDVRGVAHEAVERMGLTARVRAATTTEEGTAYLGRDGRLLGRIPAVQGRDGPTAELEVLRGDLARILLQSLPHGVDVRFGDRITAVEPATGRVALASGAEDGFDLVVVAEGVRSRTRDLVFDRDVERTELGLQMAYGTIPRTDDDDRWWRWYAAPGRRGITLRPDAVGSIRATLAFVDRLQPLADLPLEAAKAVLADVFAGAGWEADRVVRGFLASDDVYVDSLAQIRMPHWHEGRVVVVGDAAWCVTPLGGGGASLALTGAAVLAASLSATDDAGTALHRYERWMRPVVQETQRLPPGTPDLFYPSSSAGVAALRLAQRALASPPLRGLGSRLAQVAETDQRLPEVRLEAA